MDTIECIATKLDVRQFDSREISPHIREKILDSARLSGSGLNTQHWRFIIVDSKDDLQKLARNSTSGEWVSGANFAVIVLTDPRYNFHVIDAGRALQNMQLAAWNYGIVSCIFTGIREEKMRNDFSIPSMLNITLVVGFGYPQVKISGKRKNRVPLNKLVFHGKYGKTV